LLDSPNFSQREIATANIIGEGASVLPVLTARFFQSSPETNYRIRKALEGIAASGDEETFLKSTAILLTLYSNGNDQIFQQIEELKVKWRAKRTGIAIAALKRSGAEVAQQKGYDNRFARQAIIARPKAPSQGGGRSEVKTEVRSVEQQKKMVETILNGDANSNRDFIFDSFPEKARVNQTLAVGVLNQNLPHLAGTTIKFPANWAAENSDADVLRELREIDDRLFVEFSGTDLTKPQWASLAAADNVVSLKLAAKQSTDVLPPTLPPSLQAMTLVGFDLEADFADVLGSCSQLSQLQLNNCRFSERAAERIDGVRTINSLVCQFEKFKMDGDLVRAMAEFGDLRALYFTAVEFEDAALVNLRRLSGVSLLYVSEIPATSKFFQNVGAMPALRSIQFKGCKLDIPAYKRLAAGSRVRMNW